MVSPGNQPSDSNAHCVLQKSETGYRFSVVGKRYMKTMYYRSCRYILHIGPHKDESDEDWWAEEDEEEEQEEGDHSHAPSPRVLPAKQELFLFIMYTLRCIESSAGAM